METLYTNEMTISSCWKISTEYIVWTGNLRQRRDTLKYALWEMYGVEKKGVRFVPVRMKCYFHSFIRFHFRFFLHCCARSLHNRKSLCTTNVVYTDFKMMRTQVCGGRFFFFLPNSRSSYFLFVASFQYQVVIICVCHKCVLMILLDLEYFKHFQYQ